MRLYGCTVIIVISLKIKDFLEFSLLLSGNQPLRIFQVSRQLVDILDIWNFSVSAVRMGD